MSIGAEASAPRASLSRADVLAVAILFALITIAFADVWFRDSCFFVRDLTRYYFPTKRIVHDIVRGGEFPLWNRFYSAGQPAASNPEYEVFYPGQWPIFLRDYFLGFRIHILIHFYIAALAMYSLMRSFGSRVTASTFSAIVFVFGGPYLSLVNLLPGFFCVSWMPFTFLFARRFLLWREKRDLAFAALLFGMQTLIFDPAVLLETAVAIVAYAVIVGRSTRARVVNLLLALLLLAAGALAGAAQVAPTLDLLRSTPRSDGMTFDAVSYWSLPPQRLGELIQPRFSGRSPYLSNGYWARGIYRQTTAPFLQTLYVGLLPLIALLTGFVLRERRVLAAGAVALVAWLAAFGEHTPLLRAAFDAGVPMLVRFPERFAIVGGIAMAVGAGFAFDRIVRDSRWRSVAAWVALGMAIAIAALTAFAYSDAYPALFASFWNATASPLLPEWIASSRTDWTVALVRAAVASSALLMMRRSGTRAAAAFILVFAALDLFQYVREITPRVGREFFEPPQVARSLQSVAPHDSRLFVEPEWSSGSTARRYFGNPSTVYWTVRNGLFPRTPAAWGLQTIYERDIDVTNMQWTNELTDAMWLVRISGRPDWAEPFMAMGNVGFRAAYRPYDEEVARHPLPREIEPLVFVPVGPNPRYYFASEFVPITSTVEFKRRLLNEHHDLRAAFANLPPQRVDRGVVRRVVESSNGAKLEVSAAGRALLVASVTYHPNWRATIDGKSAVIHRTNIAFQSIEVPPGTHTIEFRYRDAVVNGGIFTSIVALALIAAVVIVERRRRVTSSDLQAEIRQSRMYPDGPSD